MAGYTVGLSLAFGATWMALAVHAWQTELHSHILLIPLVVGYLVWCGRGRIPDEGAGSPVAGGILATAGIALLIAVPPSARAGLGLNDFIACRVTAYLCLLFAGGLAILGWQRIRPICFPLLFLGFLIPLPDGFVVAIETWLMTASAEVCDWLFRLVRIPFYREGQVFELPGIVLEVARECSGIRSTWVLLITSLLASYLLLDSPVRRGLLVFAVVPLGVLRNAVRIVVIGSLCVWRDPEMIHHWIHKSGGPLFFAISLVPLLVLAWWLRRGEQRRNVSDLSADSEHTSSGDEAKTGRL